MGRLFHPAATLFGRLRYAYKIMFVPFILLIPLVFVATAYVGQERDQIAFSAAERDGVEFLGPLLDLTARTVQARRLAVTGRDPAPAGITSAIGPVEAAHREHGAALQTDQSWKLAKVALAGAAVAGPEPAPAYDAYSNAITQLIAVIVVVSDKSNLSLDPDLDSYYLMDALIFRIPILLDLTGQAADRAALALAGNSLQRDAARMNLAAAGGALTTTLAAVEGGMTTAFANTASPVLPRVKPQIQAAHDTLQTVLDQVKRASTIGELNVVTDAAAEQAHTAIVALAAALLPRLNGLLDTRIGGLQREMYELLALAAAALLVGGYLLVGFYRSVTSPIRRMVTAMDRLADGDLTGSVPIDTSDEIAHMAAALNRSTARTREAIVSLATGANQVTVSSRELTAVSARMRSAAEVTAVEAAGAGAGAEDTSGSINAVATSARQMSAAIGEIAQAASRATAVTGEAVGAVGAIESTVGNLGHSSTRIGEVVKAISAVAAQTNLLALNATIEAARAGDAGKGFAVVAEEVKNLSQETARATEDIIAMVSEIRGATDNAAGSIAEISDVIGRINDFQSTIASAVEEQTATTAEIGRVITQAALGSDKVASRVRAVATTADTARGSATTTEQAARELAHTSTELAAIVARFTVA